ncbi:hypothetical protein GCM10007167_14290 [Vulcaniibacterium thermophilum]|uniref:Uncharacterized protein n=1 Tax=Vulcaniibacterium thermophilum TaxID=1169913 RepID=A0A919DC20_9GAMM|nr:hypothetical protein GCM10007167_14290 [Vulcaniibacterium thermophilum]
MSWHGVGLRLRLSPTYEAARPVPHPNPARSVGLSGAKPNIDRDDASCRGRALGFACGSAQPTASDPTRRRSFLANLESRLPTPDSRLPAPDSRLPAPGSRLPTPDSRLPTPDSRLPIPDSRFPIPDSRFPIPRSAYNPQAESARQSRHLRMPRKVRAPQGTVPGNAWAARADGKCNREQTADGPRGIRQG